MLVLLCTTGCSSFDIVNAMSPSCGYRRTADIPYGTAARQKLDLYQPTSTAKPARIVVFFYGGSWQHGNKADYRFAAEAFTSKGYIAVLPDYRLYPQVTFPAFVQDAALAVRWVHDHAKQIGGDPSHIYLAGHSAGAHIAILVASDPRYLQQVGLDRSAIRAAVGLAGPYDFKINGKLQLVFPPATQPADPSCEPIDVVDGKEPPLLLLNGQVDATVEPGNATRLAGKIHQLGGQATVKIYPHTSHTGIVAALAFPFRWFSAPVLDDSVAFFRQH
jgi:acetyl esterase/lipase